MLGRMRWAGNVARTWEVHREESLSPRPRTGWEINSEIFFLLYIHEV